MIQLTASQRRRLKAAAQASGASISELVRVAVERLLAEREAEGKWARLRAAAGTVHDPGAAAGVARRHDEFLDDDRSRE